MTEVSTSAGTAASPATIDLADGHTREQLGALISCIVNHALTLRDLGSQLTDEVGSRDPEIPGHVQASLDTAALHADCVQLVASQVGWIADQIARACGMPLVAYQRGAEGWLLPPSYNEAADRAREGA